jgi:hypothetical protein
LGLDLAFTFDFAAAFFTASDVRAGFLEPGFFLAVDFFFPVDLGLLFLTMETPFDD